MILLTIQIKCYRINNKKKKEHTMRRKIISFVAAAVMAFGLFLNFLPAISAAASDNLIQNGSFEDGLVAGSWAQPSGD